MVLRTNVTSINRLILYLKSINALGDPEQSPAKCCFLHDFVSPPLPQAPKLASFYQCYVHQCVYFTVYRLHLLSFANVK